MRLNVRKHKLASVFPLLCLTTLGSRAEDRAQAWHYAANGNLNAAETFVPAEAGFNLADVSSSRELNLLPAGVKGLVWLGQCDGVTTKFAAAVSAVVDHPKVFGFFLMDDPDPTGIWHYRCKASDLRAESDWIHQLRPELVTIVALMNMGSSASPRFSVEYAPENSHVDLFAVSPYPCRTGWAACDYDMINRFLVASQAAGFPLSRTVPTFQAFGGGSWRADSGGAYRLPRPSELQSIIERWDDLVPTPAFDFAYSWGQQHSDDSLAASADLRAIFARRNRAAQGSPAHAQ
jgi:hypothetical protein